MQKNFEIYKKINKNYIDFCLVFKYDERLENSLKELNVKNYSNGGSKEKNKKAGGLKNSQVTIFIFKNLLL